MAGRSWIEAWGGAALASLAVLAVLAVLGVACGGSSGSAQKCQHPCDLHQTIRVEITGSDPAATITVTGACEAQLACPTKDSCPYVDLQLTNGGTAWSEPDATDMVCHITAVSRSGVTVERDVNASYTSGGCCYGWELPFVGEPITFDRPDAASD